MSSRTDIKRFESRLADIWSELKALRLAIEGGAPAEGIERQIMILQQMSDLYCKTIGLLQVLEKYNQAE